jgi:serine/threonine kinase 32
MAPELISGTGYFCSVDWWSLGVIMFEMIYGERPFRTKMRKQLIKKGCYRFPSGVQTTQDCRDAIAAFLRMDAHTRLGVGFEGMVALKRHPFFASIAWDLIPHKEVEPVYVPSKDREWEVKDVDVEELRRAVKATKKRRSTKIMSTDMITIYYEFSVSLLI